MEKFSRAKLLMHRKAAGLSHVKLAHKMNLLIGPNTIARIESGRAKRAPTLDVAIAIAKALNVSLKDLTDAKS